MTATSEIFNFIARNWALCSIAATITMLVLIPYLILQKYVRLSLNIFTDTEPPLSMTQVSHPRLPGDEVDFWATDGMRLAGVFMHPPPELKPKGLILFAPEFKSDRYSCARYCLPLLRAGYDVFSFDFRGHGRSSREEGYTPRQWSSDREIADIRGAIAYCTDWLEQQGRPPEIGLFGISRGAAAGVLAAAQNPAIKCFVTDGLFSSDAALEHLMKRWAYIFARVKFVYENHPPEFWMFLCWAMMHKAQRKFGVYFPSVRKVLPTIRPRPMLLIHGGRDSYISVDQARLLYALAPQPRYLWIVPEARHNQSVTVQPAAYARRTVEFFDRFLAGEHGPDNLYQQGRFAEWAMSELGPAADLPRAFRPLRERAAAEAEEVSARAHPDPTAAPAPTPAAHRPQPHARPRR